MRSPETASAGSDPYRALQEHLHSMPTAYPPSASGAEIALLKSVFTPEEALVALHLGHEHRTVGQIFQTAKEVVDSEEALQRTLDGVVSKGGLSRRRRDGEEQYALVPLLLWGMYEYQVKRLDPQFLGSFGQYLTQEAGMALASEPLPRMRVIPVEESVEPEMTVASYDELRALIEQSGDHIAIQDCVCRRVNDLQGKQCTATDRREVCMSFGDLSDMYVEEGWGRRITRAEALDIARRNQEEGLVMMPGNAQEATFMCACCSDCCGMLSMLRHFPRPADVIASNYQAAIVAERCTACEDCVDRCPLDAVAMVDGMPEIALGRCVGCGVCVPFCPADAMHLVSKPRQTVPPPTEEALFRAIAAARMRGTPTS